MTAPQQFVPKTLIQVSAMHYNAWDGTGQEVKDWIVGLMSASFGDPEVQIQISDNGMGMFAVLAVTPAEEEGQDPDIQNLMQVTSDQIVFLDEDGFHVLNKSIFDTLYKPVV